MWVFKYWPIWKDWIVCSLFSSNASRMKKKPQAQDQVSLILLPIFQRFIRFKVFFSLKEKLHTVSVDFYFAIHCAAYGTERLFSLVLFNCKPQIKAGSEILETRVVYGFCCYWGAVQMRIYWRTKCTKSLFLQRIC